MRVDLTGVEMQHLLLVLECVDMKQEVYGEDVEFWTQQKAVKKKLMGVFLDSEEWGK